MNPRILTVGAFEENCIVFTAEGGAWIVDPGAEPEAIAAAVAQTGLPPKGILLTHGHFDHIGAIPELQRRWPDLPVFISEADFMVLNHPMNQFPPEYPPIKRPDNLKNAIGAQELSFLEVIETPGHTPGSVVYLWDGVLFSGDTLFAGSIGRTDLPGGSFATIQRSLKVLKALPPETHVMPGHGPTTTIAAELRSNPYLV